MSEELRGYSFQNFYLQGIHAGIQSAHAYVRMFLKYPEIDLRDYAEATSRNPPSHVVQQSKKADLLRQWGRHHETMIVLNGGMQKDLQALVDLLTQADDDDLNDFPWAKFCEAEEALNGALTNVSIVLPERIFKYSFDTKSAVYAMGEETQSFQLPNGKSFQWRGDTLVMTVPQSEGEDLVLEYNRFEIRLMEIMAGLKLMS